MSVKGVISEEDWDNGTSASGSIEKSSAVISYLGTVHAAKMSAIALGTKLKWPYSTVQALVKAGTLERKKIGKAYFYRLKQGKRST